MSKFEEVGTLLFKCESIPLEMTPEFSSSSTGEIASYYNGIGPEWSPAWARKAATWYMSVFAPAAVIHDFEYATAARTEQAKEDADDRFYANCRRCIRHLNLKWYNPRRWLLERKAFIGWRMVRRLGNDAFFTKQ